MRGVAFFVAIWQYGKAEKGERKNMKKLLAFLVCAVVIIGQLLLPVTGRQAIMPGDLDVSRSISATDALICLQGAVGKYELNDDSCKNAEWYYCK